MRYGDRFDLDIPGCKEYIQHVINSYGVSKSINELGLSVRCKTETGDEFELVQLRKTRNIVAVCGV